MSRAFRTVIATAAVLAGALQALGTLAGQPAVAQAKADADFTRQQDVIYGRKFGTALTMDVFTPKAGANGAGVVFAVSGGWVSDPRAINVNFISQFVKRGYTVFAVVHGSQPRFTIPDAVDDMHRSVRYIRHRAKDFGVAADRLGVAGGSAGGHLSLMLGTTGKDGDPKAADMVDRSSSRVQAVACFFPPTDFLNYGEPGRPALGRGTLDAFKAPFDFQEVDKVTRSFNMVLDEAKRREIGKQISPVYHVTSASAPALIIHGDADKLVPIQQAELMIAALTKAGVPAELVVKKGAAHGWAAMEKDIGTLADWFDKYLGQKK